MMIENLEDLRGFATKLMDAAKRQLSEDDDLCAIVILLGETQEIQLDPTMPREFVNGALRQFIRRHDDMEVAAFVSLGYAVEREVLVADEDVDPKSDPNHYLVISVHVSHREQGMLANYVRVTRRAPKQFEFGEPNWADEIHQSPMLANLWPRPRLN